MLKPRRLVLTLPVLVLVVLQCFPVLLVLLTSFRTEVSLLEFGPLALEGLFLGNYARVLGDDAFLSHLGASLLIAAGSTALAVVLGSLAAYGLSRLRFSGRRLLASSILVSRVVPPVALAIPVFLLLRSIGLTDSILGLIVAHTSFNLPFAIWLMMPFFAGLPRELEEAAFLDGCSSLSAFRIVMLPLALPGILVAAVFCFLASWNDFLFSMVLAGSKTKTAPLAVNAYMTGFGPEWGPMTASSLLILAPVLLLSLVLRRHMVGGLTAGGVKDA